jgi:exo-beta-1,3-glucanase (GH17 family)
MLSTTRQHLIRYALAAVMLALALGLVARAALDGREVDLVKAPDIPINCASYTPSGDARIRYNLKVPREVIVADLKLLAGKVRCVRTYTVGEGLDQVPEIARELGLRVMLGFWISADPKFNAQEIARGIELANANADVIDAVIVGNEVLLRRELQPAQLRALIDQVRAAVSVPVTYADVWEFWLRNASLADSVSFVTAHILPYWEDHPIDVKRALDHVRSIHSKVKQAFPNKEVFIGETGWPSEGRPRLNAIPSLVNEAKFIREFLTWANQDNVRYNIIEAFDQPWKRAQEGTVGGYWGLFDSQGRQKFPLQLPVTARDDWRLGPIAALLSATFSLLFFWKLWPLFRNERFTWQALAFLGIAGHAAGSVLVMQWRYLLAANRSTIEWVGTLLWSGFGWAAFAVTCIHIARWLDAKPATSIPSIAYVTRHLGYRTESIAARWLGVLRFAVLVGTAYVCLGLVYEGRGRDFPLSTALLPVVGFALHAALASLEKKSNVVGREELFLSAVLILSSVAIVWIETVANTRALLWCGLSWLFAASILLPSLLGRTTQQHQSPEQHANAG